VLLAISSIGIFELSDYIKKHFIISYKHEEHNIWNTFSVHSANLPSYIRNNDTETWKNKYKKLTRNIQDIESEMYKNEKYKNMIFGLITVLFSFCSIFISNSDTSLFMTFSSFTHHITQLISNFVSTKMSTNHDMSKLIEIDEKLNNFERYLQSPISDLGIVNSINQK
jgi:hypothetical protein